MFPDVVGWMNFVQPIRAVALRFVPFESAGTVPLPSLLLELGLPQGDPRIDLRLDRLFGAFRMMDERRAQDGRLLGHDERQPRARLFPPLSFPPIFESMGVHFPFTNSSARSESSPSAAAQGRSLHSTSIVSPSRTGALSSSLTNRSEKVYEQSCCPSCRSRVQLQAGALPRARPARHSASSATRVISPGQEGDASSTASLALLAVRVAAYALVWT
jgi:hypothetical protein